MIAELADVPTTPRSPVRTEETPARQTGVRPMRPEDIPTVGRLFTKIFRKHDEPASRDLVNYMQAVFFGSPAYTEETGSIVHEGPDGINSAILSIPVSVMVHDRAITARILCAFMADGPSAAGGAARLARNVRAARQDFCFTDNAAPVSAEHWQAGGGVILPVESLEWARIFRPAGAALAYAWRNAQSRPPALLRGLAGLVDPAIRAAKRNLVPAAPNGLACIEAPLERFFDCARAMTADFAVRPVWDDREGEWLVRAAALNARLGKIRCRIVNDASGQTIGAALYFSQPRGVAKVLNIVWTPGRQAEVLPSLFACLEAEGHVMATGMAMPALMRPLGLQPNMVLRHRGYFCMVTRHEDLKAAAQSGDIYVGGLVSESWSRLLTDF